MVSSTFVVAVAFLASWVLTRLSIPFLLSNFLDQPNERSSHCLSTPRGGGFVFVFIACVASSVFCFASSLPVLELPTLVAVPLMALPLALVGFVDDRYNIPVLWRYSAQLITALVLILALTLAHQHLSRL